MVNIVIKPMYNSRQLHVLISKRLQRVLEHRSGNYVHSANRCFKRCLRLVNQGLDIHPSSVRLQDPQVQHSNDVTNRFLLCSCEYICRDQSDAEVAV